MIMNALSFIKRCKFHIKIWKMLNYIPTEPGMYGEGGGGGGGYLCLVRVI